MTATPAGYLVWRNLFGKPAVEKWSAYSFAVTPATKKDEDASILARHPLSAEEYDLPLAELMKLYPAPVVREDEAA